MIVSEVMSPPTAMPTQPLNMELGSFRGGTSSSSASKASSLSARLTVLGVPPTG